VCLCPSQTAAGPADQSVSLDASDDSDASSEGKTGIRNGDGDGDGAGAGDSSDAQNAAALADLSATIKRLTTVLRHTRDAWDATVAAAREARGSAREVLATLAPRLESAAEAARRLAAEEARLQPRKHALATEIDARRATAAAAAAAADRAKTARRRAENVLAAVRGSDGDGSAHGAGGAADDAVVPQAGKSIELDEQARRWTAVRAERGRIEALRRRVDAGM
jgi:hypothetical protein